MLEFLYSIAPYAPAALFVAATLDIFFVTGLILYGVAMLSSVAMMYANDMISAPTIAVSAFLGTVVGNCINFYAGRLFVETNIVARQLAHPRMKRPRALLQSRGLFLYILIGRFITFTRPLYALLLGSLGIQFRRFIVYESIIAAFWIVFWLQIIISGESLIMRFLSH